MRSELSSGMLTTYMSYTFLHFAQLGHKCIFSQRGELNDMPIQIALSTGLLCFHRSFIWNPIIQRGLKTEGFSQI